MTIGTFVTSTLGMNSQAHAMDQISSNIANVKTTGYKKVDPRFETFMKEYNEIGVNTHYFSSNNVDRRMVDISGQLQPTGSIYDLALSGRGFFVIEGQHNTLYSRAGDFQATAVTPPGYPAQSVTFYRPAENGVVTQSAPANYFVNSSGYYVMGWNYNNDAEAFSSSLEPVIISPMEYYPGHKTTQMSFKGNINASATETQLLKFPVYDSDSVQHTMTMKWEPQNDANTWTVTIDIDGAAVSSEPINVVFDEFGKLRSPLPTSTLSINWEAGGSSDVSLDFQNLTQFANALTAEVRSQDGKGFGALASVKWDENGVLNAAYSNGCSVPVCKVAIAHVQVPNMMEAVSGNMFAYTQNAGNLEILDLQETRTETTVQGGTKESSNVSLEEEFTNMIVTQRAYSSNVKTFTTVNEMTQEAISILT
ncbi:MAG: flagellar hook-basal body complex protein [Alphaproteobacteria bacterium]|nr:flagellar hook-basal body complex protein [Alphaproteobacteria bacterium]